MKSAFLPGSGGIVSHSINDNILILDRRLSGPTAIGFDCETLPGNPVCEIWSPEVRFSADHASVVSLPNAYYLQFGAYDGTMSFITRGGDARQVIAIGPVKPRAAHSYHVRAEIADDRIALLVDGRLLCSSTEEFYFNSGYLGILTHYLGKVFRNIRVNSRGTPRKAMATAIGDAFVHSGDLTDAATTQFGRGADPHPGSALGREALFKQRLCSLPQRRYRCGIRDLEAVA